LAWEFSSYRDYAGLIAGPRAQKGMTKKIHALGFRSWDELHRFMSSDFTTQAHGTPQVKWATKQNDACIASAWILQLQIARSMRLPSENLTVRRALIEFLSKEARWSGVVIGKHLQLSRFSVSKVLCRIQKAKNTRFVVSSSLVKTYLNDSRLLGLK
jgi:hypothetical protein